VTVCISLLLLALPGVRRTFLHAPCSLASLLCGAWCWPCCRGAGGGGDSGSGSGSEYAPMAGGGASGSWGGASGTTPAVTSPHKALLRWGIRAPAEPGPHPGLAALLPAGSTSSSSSSRAALRRGSGGSGLGPMQGFGPSGGGNTPGNYR
jgi:hypothetical protein